MSMIIDYKCKCKMVCDANRPTEVRIFAALECILQPVSFITIIALIVSAITKRLGIIWMPRALQYFFPVLLSAAVGYLTNWIAIEMLFKPYTQKWSHPFSLLTFGYWKQGLVPKNKGRISVVMGNQVAEKLLKPEKLADDLCSMVGGVLEDRDIISKVQISLRELILSHSEEIIEALSPKIEEALVKEIDKLITADNVEKFWSEVIEPRLASEEMREKVATLLVRALESRVPSLAAKVKPMIVKAIEKFVEEKMGMLGGMILPFIGGIADVIVSKETIENALSAWLEDPSTLPALRDELVHIVDALRAYLKSAEAQNQIGGFIQEMRLKFKGYLHAYLEENFPKAISAILDSDEFSKWASLMLPKVKPQVEDFIRKQGMPLIIEKLDIQGRIKRAVDAMDVAEFHEMVNGVAAEHLGAIQVLGYILGFLVGACMLII